MSQSALTHPLHRCLQRVEQTAAADRLPVIVFDLDSTLFDTGPRNLRILHEFVASEGDPIAIEAASRLGARDMGWNVVQALADAGVEDQSLLNRLRDFWKRRFFTDEYVTVDSITPGAARFARAVWERGALLYYLTGRHVDGMELGTVRNLVRHNMPWGGGRVVCHLKPDFHMADEPFKLDAISEIKKLRGEVVATFENEPANANMLAQAFPDSMPFFLDTVHSPNPAPLHEQAIRIPHFLY